MFIIFRWRCFCILHCRNTGIFNNRSGQRGPVRVTAHILVPLVWITVAVMVNGISGLELASQGPPGTKAKWGGRASGPQNLPTRIRNVPLLQFQRIIHMGKQGGTPLPLFIIRELCYRYIFGVLVERKIGKLVEVRPDSARIVSRLSGCLAFRWFTLAGHCVCSLVFIFCCVRPKGPWQRLRRCLNNGDELLHNHNFSQTDLIDLSRAPRSPRPQSARVEPVWCK